MQQTISKLKQRIPELAEEPRSAEAQALLNVPETLTRVINLYAGMLADTLDGPNADLAAARDTWQSMLNVCVIWRDHPALPAGLRDALAAAEEPAAS